LIFVSDILTIIIELYKAHLFLLLYHVVLYMYIVFFIKRMLNSWRRILLKVLILLQQTILINSKLHYSHFPSLFP